MNDRVRRDVAHAGHAGVVALAHVGDAEALIGADGPFSGWTGDRAYDGRAVDV
jgi:hypothetical protein